VSSRVRIQEVVVPADEVPDDVRALVEGASEVLRACALEVWGHTDLVRSPDAWLHHLAHGIDHRWTLWVALADGRVVGCVTAGFPLVDNLHLVEAVDVQVAQRARRLGVGSALLDAVVARSRALERTHLAGWSHGELAASEDPRALRSRTDPQGLAPSPASAFALRHGFAVAQIERHSVLRIGDASASDGVAAGYRIQTWRGATPPDWLDGLARVWTAFSTSAPLGELAWGEESWDADRIAASEAASGAVEDRLTAIVVHEASGEVVAGTQLIRDRDQDASAGQGVTVALDAHRGHGLGLAMKRANLALASDAWPKLERIHTWNAGENDHMWRINAKLGFQTEGGEVCWQRVL
jgi:GNAT superfamily N-acetyltransferase